MFTENTAKSVYEQCFWVVGSGLLDIKQKTGLPNPQREGVGSSLDPVIWRWTFEKYLFLSIF